ncbi:MAG: DMT family transporter [Candidatus Methanomethyliaceae archaeon]|nr:DMT family transporter [Candidatus Methanomethyliaceae archaeon]
MKIKSTFLLIITVVLWGSSFVFIKLGLEEIAPLTLALLRFAIATPFLLILVGLTSGFKGLLRGWKHMLILGMTGVAAYHAFQNIGMSMTSASESSIIIASNPIFIAMFGRRFLKERLRPIGMAGIILAFVGVFTIVVRNGLSLGYSSTLGNLLCLGSVFSWTAYSIYGKRKLQENNANEITAYSSLFGTILLAPPALISEGFRLPTSYVPWISLLALGFFCSGIAYLFWYKALEGLPASEAGSYLFLIPVIASTLAYFILGERLDSMFFFGALLVIIGVIMTTRSHHTL